MHRTLIYLSFWAAMACACPVRGETLPERGYRLLTTKAYLPADFDDDVFAELWQTWEEPLRSQAEAATPGERRLLAFTRYGLMPHPDHPDGLPLQYVSDGKGGWCMTCLACHSGKVAGQVIPGLPNTHYGLQTLTEEVRQTKLRLKKPLTHMDLGSLTMPLGSTHGTTNAVMFGVALLAHRDPDLNVHKNLARPTMVHHDHDAPPWWNVRHKTFLYADGFVSKSPRALMQFLLVPQNGPEEFRNWEDDYGAILAWIESLEPPKYPFAIEATLARQGQAVFENTCARCHGTYGRGSEYPNKVVELSEVGTDPVRATAIEPEARERYGRSWFNSFGRLPTVIHPEGYVAPPLDGIWASAPYFHNGSVPTLRQVLFPEERPTIWRRSEDGYDTRQVGLEYTAYEELPDEARQRVSRRHYFDTRLPGKSALGHRFAEVLSEPDREALLEYLKTL